MSQYEVTDINVPEWKALTYLQEHLPYMDKWNPQIRTEWFKWHWANGIVGIYEEDDVIHGVFVGRRVSDEQQAKQEYAISLVGGILFVDQVAISNVSLKDFFLEGCKKFSWINFISFRRLERKTFKTYPINRFYNTLEKCKR